MALIFYTYSKVFKVLWKIDKGIAMDDNETSNVKENNSNILKENDRKHNNLDVNQSSVSGSRKSISINNTNANQITGNSTAKSKMKNQLIARRKAAKMLISVAILFGLCYLPIHILNILR